MKRILGILSLAVIAVPGMAQTEQPSPDTGERVQMTLKAATAAEPSAETVLPASDRSAEIDPPQVDRVQAQQPDVTATSQADSKPIPSSCAALEDEIERKIRANGVPLFSLDVLPTVEAESRVALDGNRPNASEIVGSCAAGSYKIVYRRG